MSTSLDMEQLLRDAEQVTGLNDWGGERYFDQEFRDLLRTMIYSLEHEAVLTEQGKRGARLRLAALLQARLNFIADRKRWPEIGRESIVKPIFILGLPRTGSTFLHSLMAQDPANRAPLAWEMMLPSPPPTPADQHHDPRIDRVESIFREIGLLRPEVMALHPFGARQPEECHFMMEMMLLGDNLPAWWRMPTYNKQRAATDLRLGYLTHRMVLQNLQFRFRGERVLLKNPGHIFYLQTLLSVYPDARFIQTHRDPAKVMPSIAALITALRRSSSDDVAPPEKVALGNLRAYADGLAKAIKFREQPGIEERFCDVHFQDLVRDPIGTVERVYEHFGLELTAQAREAMQRWLADPANRSPKGRHTLRDYGLDEAMIDAAFADYMRHYDVARERAGA